MSESMGTTGPSRITEMDNWAALSPDGTLESDELVKTCTRHLRGM